MQRSAIIRLAVGKVEGNRPLFTGGRSLWICLLASILLLAQVSVATSTGGTAANSPDKEPVVLLSRQSLGPEHLGIIVNDLDPTSRQIASYYAAKRGIPAANLIHVRFAPGLPVMKPKVFQALYEKVQANTPKQVQAYALTWTTPFRVGCMSITTAFAAGYDEAFCATGCKPTRHSPYFASLSERPNNHLDWRPTMALAGRDFEAVKALIDRGVASDDSRPGSTAYLVYTSDKARNVCASLFDRVSQLLGSR